MKAIVYTQYGPPDVLQLQDVAEPVLKETHVLVRVRAASINALDWRRFASQSLMGRLMDSMSKSSGKVLGADISGQVEAVGSAVSNFKVGDEVFGISSGSVGAFAELARSSEKWLALKPANVSFEQAAAVPVAALTALQGLRDQARVQSDQKVLIVGAGGGVGSFAVQIAKSYGADVAAVCSTWNLEMARSIGADHVIDYMQEDITRSDQRYDVIFAVNGHYPILAYRKLLTSEGTYMAAGGSLRQIFAAMLLGPLLSKFGHKKLGFMGIAQANAEDLGVLRDLLQAGTIVPVIDRTYPLEETANAMKYVSEGHSKGKVVITVH